MLSGCDATLPEPVTATPELRRLSVYVQPANVDLSDDDCSGLSNRAAEDVRLAVTSELEAAGMHVVALATSPHEVDAWINLRLKSCGQGNMVFSWAAGLLLLGKGPLQIVSERTDAEGTPMGGIKLASIGKIAAAKLVRSMLASQHLQDAARIPAIQAQSKRGGDAGVGNPVSGRQRAASSVPSSPAASAQPRDSTAPIGVEPSSPSEDAPAAPAALPGNTERAAALFREGRTEVKAGNYSRACALFGESHRLDPAPGTLMNLADCEEHVGRLLSARLHWKKMIELLPETGDARLPHGHQRLEELERRIPRLVVRLSTGAPNSTRVLLDGLVVSETALGTPMMVDPGEHTITVEAPGRTERVFPLRIGDSEKKQLTVGPAR